MTGHDLHYNDDPAQAPARAFPFKTPVAQHSSITKNSLLHQIKQQKYQNGMSGKKLNPVFMRTEYAGGIFPRHGSI